MEKKKTQPLQKWEWVSRHRANAEVCVILLECNSLKEVVEAEVAVVTTTLYIYMYIYNIMSATL